MQHKADLQEHSSVFTENPANWKLTSFTIGRSPISHGSYCKTYKARRDCRLYAIKIWRRGVRHQNLFEFTQKILVDVVGEHPNVIKTFAMIQHEEKVMYSVHEFAACDLFHYITVHPKLKCPQVAYIVRCVTEVLLFLRNKNLFYCDVKPENVLVMHDKTLKICDFNGVVRKLGPLGVRVCTKVYKPPEAWSHVAGLAWTVGMMAYECATNSTDVELSALAALASNDFRDFLHGVLEPDPDKRLTLEMILEHPFVVAHKAVIQL